MQAGEEDGVSDTHVRIETNEDSPDKNNEHGGWLQLLSPLPCIGKKCIGGILKVDRLCTHYGQAITALLLKRHALLEIFVHRLVRSKWGCFLYRKTTRTFQYTITAKPIGVTTMNSHPISDEEAVAAADKEMEARANRAKEILSQRYVGLKRQQVRWGVWKVVAPLNL